MRAFAQVKIACARANAAVGALQPKVAEALVAAGREVAEGRWLDQFPLAVVQGGGGTATNMNMNEVLAARASQLLEVQLHPNDHANRSQSTNDIYPTALAIAAYGRTREALAAFAHLRQAVEAKAFEYPEQERLGRTCLQDAVPITIRSGHLAQAHAIARTSAGLESAVAQVLAVPLGGTVLGTGIGAPAGYRERAVAYLADETGFPVESSADPFDALAHLDPYVEVMHALVRVMLVLGKLASDLRILSSGPAGGIGEVSLPAVQIGSSIMPGKINPVIPELVMQIAAEVRGSALTVECAACDGELELNIMEPVITRHVLVSLSDTAQVARIFADRCVAGLTWNRDVVEQHVVASLANVVRDAVVVGYDAAAETLRPNRFSSL